MEVSEITADVIAMTIVVHSMQWHLFYGLSPSAAILSSRTTFDPPMYSSIISSAYNYCGIKGFLPYLMFMSGEILRQLHEIVPVTLPNIIRNTRGTGDGMEFSTSRPSFR